MNSCTSSVGLTVRMFVCFVTVCFLFTVVLPCDLMAEKVTIPSGTNVILKTTAHISTETKRRGDQVNVIVAYDVIVKDKVVIGAGASANGIITNADTKGMFGSAGKIGFEIRNTNAVDGVAVPLSGDKYAEGKDKQLLSWLLCLLVCPVAAFIKGGSAELPSGTQITCNTIGAVPVEVK